MDEATKQCVLKRINLGIPAREVKEAFGLSDKEMLDITKPAPKRGRPKKSTS